LFWYFIYLTMSTYIITPLTEHEKIVEAFLNALEIPFVKEEEEALPEHVLEGIKRNEEDFKAGRTITF